MSSIIFRGYYPHTGSSPFLCPSLSTWRKPAFLETPEQNFFAGRNSRCTFDHTPLTPTWEKSGKMTPPPGNFFQHADRHRRFLPSLLNVQNRAFWKPLSKIFTLFSHEYQQSSIIHVNSASTISCQRLHIVRCPSM